MIKANELRIGNRVFRSFGQEWEIVTVDTNDIRLAFSFENCYKPIPLTEEWLLRFGFNHKGEEYYQVGRYELDIINGLLDDGYTAVNLDNPIKYVHELQNLYFALTGEELIFKTKKP